jgi:hypothetical protein
LEIKKTCLDFKPKMSYMGGGAIQAGNQDDFSIMGQVNFATGPTTIFSSDMFGEGHCKCRNCHKMRILLFKIMLYENPGADQEALTIQLTEFTGHEVAELIRERGPLAMMIAHDDAIAQAEEAMIANAIASSAEISKKKTPVPQEIIEKLCKVKFTLADVEAKTICSVCTMSATEEEIGTEVFRLECGHKFHLDCLLPWITAESDECPVCRTKIVAPVSVTVEANAAMGGGGGGGSSEEA